MSQKKTSQWARFELIIVCFYNGLRPVIILYSITITAITNNTCIKLFVPMPGITPRNPRSQTIIQITATSQRIPLIVFGFKLCY